MSSARESRSKAWMRQADRRIGIPALFVLGLLHRKRKLPAEVQKIAMLKSTAIGDTILLSAAIQALRTKYPQAHLTLFVGPSNLVAAKVLGGVDHVECLPVTSPLRAIRQLRRFSFDVWLDFGSWPRLEALYSFFSRSHCQIGFRSPGQRRHYAQDLTVDHLPSVHESVNYQRLLTAMGIVSKVSPIVTTEHAQPLASPLSGPYVVLHMWAGGSQADKKHWPDNQWAQLVQRLQSAGLQVALSGGPTDKDKNLEFYTHHQIKNVQQFAGISFAQTLTLLKGANAVVSIDTGILHLASALGVKTVGIHGPTHSLRWGAVGTHTRSLNACELVMTPIHFGWEAVREQFTDKISVPQVVHALQDLQVI